MDVVVGADGANGITARAFGLGEGIVHGVALEGNVAYGRVSRERYARRAVIELADIPGGYGWVFPKGDHVNVGVGAWQAEGPRLREHLGARLRGARPATRTSSPSVRGHRLPLRRPATRIAGERTLLVGDAAGLIDPVSGDGMYECFVSASLAAARSSICSPAGRPRSSRTRLRSTRRSARCTARRGSSSARSTAGRAHLADRADEAALALGRAAVAR